MAVRKNDASLSNDPGESAEKAALKCGRPVSGQKSLTRPDAHDELCIAPPVRDARPITNV
ncbi:hypothetical protein [Burkholderia ubonensis]|uniref:hypothetical protein n=1 Tax=Burkholderia ubonensis TaxID=101571 RepID=UPI000AD78A42|nr:hypothetical protein [Burkholderia ubonensis]